MNQSPYAAPPNEVLPHHPESGTTGDVIAVAQFDPRVCRYWITSACLTSAVTIVGIVLVPLILLLGPFIAKKYLMTHHLELGRRELRLRKGLLTKIEKTLPLEKITDVGLTQGPLMRWIGVDGLSMETAGQTSQGALLSLQGVIDARGFRDKVLAQRDQVSGESSEPAPTGGNLPATENPQVVELRQLNETMKRIEALLRQDRDG